MGWVKPRARLTNNSESDSEDAGESIWPGVARVRPTPRRQLAQERDNKGETHQREGDSPKHPEQSRLKRTRCA
jgi:hypothetical protein